MLRKLAASTGAAVIAAGLAAAPGVAAQLPGAAGEPCGDVAPAEPTISASFVFGPYADVPQLSVAKQGREPEAG